MANFSTTESISSNHSDWGECSPTTTGFNTGKPSPIRLVLGGVTFTGCLGNVVFLIVAFRHKSMHYSTNIYFINRALGDLSVLILGSIGVIIDILEYLPKNFLSCTYIVLATVPFFASMFMIALSTLDQFYAICRPLKHLTFSGMKRSLKLAATGWFISLLYSALINVENGLSGNGCQAVQASSRDNDCNPEDEPSPRTIFSDVLRPTPVILLFFLSIWLNLTIMSTLRKSCRNACSSTVPVRLKNLRKSQVRIVKMLAVTTFAFFGFNTPRTCLLMLDFVRGIQGLPPFYNETLTVISTTFLMLNLCINPFIYFSTNQKYRKAFLEVFCPKGCHGRGRKTSSISVSQTVPA